MRSHGRNWERVKEAACGGVGRRGRGQGELREGCRVSGAESATLMASSRLQLMPCEWLYGESSTERATIT